MNHRAHRGLLGSPWPGADGRGETRPGDTGGGADRLRRVLILGGGHAGAHVAAHLLKRRRPEDKLEIAVVDYLNHEVFHGLMPQIVGGLVQPQLALVPLRQILPGATLYTYQVEEVDLPNRRVLLNRGDERDHLALDYDYLVLALGSVTDLSRFPGLLEHGLQTKTMGDIVHLRAHLIDMLERASVETDPEERRRLLTFVVAGGGWTGVEIGGQARDLLRSALRFFPTIEDREIRFVLLSSAARLLPALNEGLAARARRYLERSGVEVRLGTTLAAATATGALFSDGERLPTRTIIVTVGVGPNPVIARLPVAMARGRVVCDPFCRVLDWPGVYAAGDNAAVPDVQGGDFYPPTALVAFGHAERVAENILAEVRGRALRRFHFEGVEAALLSRGHAIAQIKALQLEGLAASLIWRLVFLAYVPTWQRRVSLVQEWLGSALFPRDIAQLRLERSDAIVPMRFGAGEVIIRQGEPGARFYIVTEGEVEIVRRGADGQEERLNTLGPGQYFGEISLLHDTARNATVRARVDTRVLSVARQDFHTLVRHLPSLRKAIAATTDARRNA